MSVFRWGLVLFNDELLDGQGSELAAGFILDLRLEGIRAFRNVFQAPKNIKQVVPFPFQPGHSVKKAVIDFDPDGGRALRHDP